MPAETLYLVSCVSKKAPTPCPARLLYESPWFKLARAYVEAQGAPWYILSAENFLLPPDRVTWPYERTLNTMPQSQRRTWAGIVWKDLQGRLTPGQRVVILAGELYRRDLVPRLQVYGYPVEIPMEGLGIGEQLSWLKKHGRP